MKNLDKNVFEDSTQCVINNESKKLLKMIVFWTKSISITGLIAASFIFLGSIFSVINRDASLGQAFPMWFLSLFAFIPLIYLFKFSKKLKEFLTHSDKIILQKSIQLLKSYFKAIGISMILIFVLFIIARVILLFLNK